MRVRYQDEKRFNLVKISREKLDINFGQKISQLMKKNEEENLELKYFDEYKCLRWTGWEISQPKKKTEEKNLEHQLRKRKTKCQMTNTKYFSFSVS